MKIKSLSIICLVLLITFAMSAQKELKNINTKLSIDATSFELKDEIKITFSVTNNWRKCQKICRYLTPFEGFYGDLLKVTIDEKDLPYRGMMVKRMPPSKEDYFDLKAGETKSISFVLKKNYLIKEKGTYLIQYLGKEYVNQLPNSNTIEVVVK